jgi:WD40 repeat protein/class 3 adenylate cyclase
MADSTSTSQILTLVFTDLVGSTALKTTHGDKPAGALIERHRDHVTNLAVAHAGTIVDWAGDGCFLFFNSASAAVLFGLELQRKHSEESDLPGVRIGIHLGEVTVKAQPEDSSRPIHVEGLSVDLTARIESLAIPGQVLMSSFVFNNVRQRLHGDEIDADISWMAHGAYEFKGFDEPMEICEAGVEGMSPLTPPEGSEKAHRAVTPAEEETLGWRPAVGLTVPRRDHWILEMSLGEGGYGEVWLALHEKTKAKRVFKFCYEPDRVRGLKREVVLFRLLKESLGHRDDIAQIVDWEFDESPYFIESEYTEGGDLKDWAEAKGGVEEIPLETRLELVAQVAVALGAAHSAGVLHKDIKPSNILISEVSGKDVPRASLTDFGIGLITDPAALAAQGITAAGFTETLVNSSTPSSGAGTRLYMAPEIVEGKPATTLSDIYSLGVVLFQLVTGDVSQAVAPGWERKIEDEVLREDIAVCVDGDPGMRLKSADELAERLRTLSERRAAIAEEAQAKKEAEENRQLAEQAMQRRRQFRLMSAAGITLTVIVGIIAFREFTLRNREQDLRIAAETAEREAVIEKENAKASEKKAIELQIVAEKAQLEAETLREEALQKNYLSDIRLTKNYLEQDNVASARGVLAATPTHLRHWEWGHLVNRAWPPDSAQQEIRTFEPGTSTAEVWKDSKPRLLTTLVGHQGLIKKVAFSPDETKVLTTSLDGTTKLWQLPEGKILWSVSSVGGPPAAAYSSDGRMVAFAAGSTGILADATTGATIHTLEGHVDPIIFIHFSLYSPVVFTASIDGTYRAWNLNDGNEIGQFKMADGARVVPSVRHIPNSTRAMVTDSGNSIAVWDFASNETIKRYQGPSPERLDASYISHDRTRAMSWERTVNGVSIWELETGEEVTPILLGPSLANFGAMFSPDDSTILFRTATKAMLVDTTHFDPDVLGGASDLVIDGPGAVSSSGSFIALPDAGDSVRILVPVRRGVVGESILLGHESIVYHADFANDSGKLYTSSFDGTAREWDLENGASSRIIAKHDAEIAVMRLNPDNQLMISFGYDNMGYITDIETGEVVFSYESKMPKYFAGTVNGPVIRLASKILEMHAFSPDGSKVIFPAANDGVAVIDLESRQELFTLGGQHKKYVYLVQFSPDSKRILTLGYQEKFVNLWDAETGEFLHRMEIDKGQIFFTRFSPDSTAVVTCDSVGDTTFWNVDDGSSIRQLRSKAGAVFHAGFSPDGSKLVVSGADSNARLWDVAKEEPIAVFKDHRSLVFGGSFSPDGKRILTIGNDNKARIWDLTGTQLEVLGLADGKLLYYAEWSPDGLSIVTCSGDHTAKIWRSVDWTRLTEPATTKAFGKQIEALRSE